MSKQGKLFSPSMGVLKRDKWKSLQVKRGAAGNFLWREEDILGRIASLNANVTQLRRFDIDLQEDAAKSANRHPINAHLPAVKIPINLNLRCGKTALAN